MAWMQVLPFLSALFCSFFIFDTLGHQDKDGLSILTISLTVLMASTPGLVWACEEALTACRQGRQTNTSVRPCQAHEASSPNAVEQGIDIDLFVP
jgi:hypothetical protein